MKETEDNMKRCSIGNCEMKRIEVAELPLEEDRAIIAISARILQHNINIKPIWK